MAFCDGENVQFGNLTFLETQSNGCDPVLVQYAGLPFWNVRDLVSYSEPSSLLPVSIPLVGMGSVNVRFPASGTLNSFECLVDTFNGASGIYTVPKSAIYRVDSTVTIACPVVMTTEFWILRIVVNSSTQGVLSAQRQSLRNLALAPSLSDTQIVTVSYRGQFTVGEDITVELSTVSASVGAPNASYLSRSLSIEQV